MGNLSLLIKSESVLFKKNLLRILTISKLVFRYLEKQKLKFVIKSIFPLKKRRNGKEVTDHRAGWSALFSS